MSDSQSQLDIVTSRMEAAGYPLKEYQREGLEWMVSHEKQGSTGYLVTDDPGLGKTIQIAALMLHNPGTTLLIVPNSIVIQWIETLQKVNPSWKIYKHMGAGRYNNRLDMSQQKYDICITTLGTLIAEADTDTMTTILHSVACLRPWNRIVLDEAHYIRNKKATCHQIVSTIPATFRVGLTGTPIQNSRRDLINLLMYVGMSGQEISMELEEEIKSHILRRNKTLLYDNPDPTKKFAPYICENLYVPFTSPDEQELYRAIQSELVMEFLKKSRMAGEGKLQMMVLEMILRLRQATAHPVIAAEAIKAKYGVDLLNEIDPHTLIPCKFEKTAELILEAPEDDKFIVFCQYSQEIERLADYLKSYHSLEVLTYTGELSISQKNSVVKRSPKVLIIQTKCGGVGLNLQQYNRVVIMSLDWNPANEIQAIARAHRLGQQKQVYVYRLLAAANPELEDTDQYVIDPSTGVKSSKLTTIDERIFQIQIRKKLVMTDVMGDSTYMDHADTKHYTEYSKTIDFTKIKLSLSELKQMAGIVKRIRPKLLPGIFLELNREKVEEAVPGASQ